MNFEYGWAQGHDAEQCAASPNDVTRMLCGRQRGHVPVVQFPFTPPNLHDRCRELIWGGSTPAGTAPARPVLADYGTCPVCGGDVSLDAAGLVVGHGEHVMRGGRLVVSETRCDGKGMAPEEEA